MDYDKRELDVLYPDSPSHNGEEVDFIHCILFAQNNNFAKSHKQKHICNSQQKRFLNNNIVACPTKFHSVQHPVL